MTLPPRRANDPAVKSAKPAGEIEFTGLAQLPRRTGLETYRYRTWGVTCRLPSAAADRSMPARLERSLGPYARLSPATAPTRTTTGVWP